MQIKNLSIYLDVGRKVDLEERLWVKKPKTHKGVLNQFGESFIKTKKMDITLSDILRKCFDARHEADYDVYATFGQKEVEKIINDVEFLIEQIRHYLS
jgi:uncharacterized protein (UPF0332 family)